MKAVHVVAGALLRGNQVLIAQRPPGKHMAGGWEFPGGKLTENEAPNAGLARELKEELGVEVLACESIAQCIHDYPDRRVLLDLWLVREFAPEPQSLEGQPLKWVELGDLPSAGLLPADAPLVDALLRHLA